MFRFFADKSRGIASTVAVGASLVLSGLATPTHALDQITSIIGGTSTTVTLNGVPGCTFFISDGTDFGAAPTSSAIISRNNTLSQGTVTPAWAGNTATPVAPNVTVSTLQACAGGVTVSAVSEDAATGATFAADDFIGFTYTANGTNYEFGFRDSSPGSLGGTTLVNGVVAGADTTAPVVQSIALQGTPASNATSVTYTVTFDENANNISLGDFTLAGTGSTTAGIPSVSATSGTSVDVVVNTIAGGDGSLRLDLNGSTDIADDAGNSAPAAFTGEVHTVAFPTITLSVDSNSVTEASGPVTVTATSSLAAAEAINVTLAFSGTAQRTGGSQDYANNTSIITIAAGTTTGTATLTFVDDALDEDDVETIIIDIADVSGNTASENGVQQQTINLSDNDDAPTLSINDVTVSEGDSGMTNASFVVSLSAASGRNVSFDVASTDGTAAAGVDYTAFSASDLAINAGFTSRSFNVALNGDAVVEADETFIVTLSNPTNATIDDAIGVGTITNDDTTTVSISGGTLNEGDGTFDFTLTSPNAVDGGFSVDVSTVDNTAIGGSDFTAISGQTVTFAGTAGETETVTATITDDAIVEGSEAFSLQFDGGSTSAGTVDTADITTTSAGFATILNIANNDSAAVTIADVSGNEDDGAITVTVALDNAVDGGFTVDVSTADGTATTGDGDYTPVTNQTLTFNGTAGETQTFTVTPTSDSDAEADETLTVSMSVLNPNTVSGAFIDVTDTGTVTILNDENVSFSVNDPSVSEGDAGSATLTYTLSLSNPAPVGGASVNFATSDGTAAAGSDYTATSGTATIAAGSSSTTVDVTIGGDQTVEVDETITLTLSNPIGTNVDIADATGTGTITNDDTAVVTVADVAVNENDGTATLTLTVDNAVDGGFSVDVSTADNTATTADSDYTAVTNATEMFVGGAGETETLTVTITGDTKVEADELIDIALSNISPVTVNAGDIDITDTAQITITNDDTATVSVADFSTIENGIFSLTLSLDNEVDGGLTVNVNTADGTAAAGSDYTALTNQAVTFAGTASETETVTVTVTNDTTVEADETFTAGLSGLSALTVDSSDITLGSDATVTITNNDTTTIIIDNRTVNEGATAGTATFNVSSFNAVDGGFSLTISTTDGTAVGGSDYTALSGQTLNFAGAALETQQVTVSLTNDSIVEADETYIVSVSGVSATTVDTADFLTTNTGTGTISNDDVATVTIADVAVDENTGTATVTLTLDNAVDGGFDVDVSTADNSATTADSDYVAVVNATETFAGTASETETLTITLGGDTKVEADEIIDVAMSNLVPVTVDASDIDVADVARITITNDDTANVTIADVTANENDGTATLTLTLDNAVDGGFDVDVSTADNTATTADSDYTAVTNATETFAGTASETETLTVALGSDTTVEADELIDVALSNLVPATVDASDINITDTAQVTLTNDDTAAVTIADVTVNEDDGTATLTLTLDNAVDGGFDVDVSTADNTATTADSDYTAVTNATETFAGTASETETLTVTIGADNKVEADEIIDVALSNLVPVTVDSSDIDITDAAQVTLTNDDQATITLSSLNTPENIGFGIITVSLDAPVQGGVSVDVSSSDGTATAGSDYTAVTSLTRTFSGTSATNGSVFVTLVDDTIVEAGETINFAMSNLVVSGVDPADVDITSTNTFTILNDDTATLTIADVSGNEDDGAITVSVVSDAAVDGGFTVDVSAADGTATVAGIDYLPLTNSTLTFAGTASEAQTFTVVPILDTGPEADETVSISMSNVSAGTVSTGDIDITDGATVTILNDDSISVSVNDPSVNETASGTTTLTYTISLSEPAPTGGASVDFATSDSTATAGSDYTATSGTATIGAGTTSTTVDVTVSGDQIVEASETITLTLSNPVGTNVIIADATGTGTITNDDQATVTVADVTANEADGTATLTLTLDSAVQGGLTVDVSTSDSTATAGSDYTALSAETVSFAGTVGETQTVSVSLTDDSTVEADETVNIALSNAAPATAQASDIDVTDTATLTITNDDTATLTISDLGQSENGGTFEFRIQSSAAVDGGFSLQVTTADGTATAGSDYTALVAETVTFAGTVNETQRLTVTVFDDAIVEAVETFTASMAGVSAPLIDVSDINVSDTATVNVNSDDTATVTVADVTVNEDSGTATLTLSVDSAVDGGFDIDITTNDGTATFADGDFTPLSNATVTFAGAASETQTIDVTLGTDSKVEADETIAVVQSNVQPVTVSRNSLFGNDTATITITNDDQASVTIADVTANEGDGTATLTLTLDNAVDGGFVVDVSTADGTATTADSDYTALTAVTQTFAGTAGETQTVNVTLGSDGKVEADETVTVSMAGLLAGTVASSDVDITDAATLTISNDDTATVTMADVTVNEDTGLATVTLTLDAAVDGGFTVDVSSSDGTATIADSDYAAVTSQTETFAGTAGETQIVDIVIGVDSAAEADETFSLSMSSVIAGTVSATSVDVTDTATVTITNDDSVGISVSDPSVSEGDAGTTGVAFTISLSQAAPAGGVTVDFATTDSTATAGADYIASSGTAIISAGGTSTTVEVRAVGDTTVEADETLTLTLSSPTGAGAQISDATGTGTITNDDTATVTVADVAANENDGTATLTLTLDNAVDGGFTVDVSTADNTATTADNDYTALTSSTQTFGGTAGETQTVNVTLGADTKVEADELIDVAMSSVVAGTVAAGDIDITDSATVTISNDDTATVTIADVTIDEDSSGLAVLTATLDNAVDGGFSVDVSTADGTATVANSDYLALVSQPLSFIGNAGETQPFLIRIGIDTDEELDETLSVSMSDAVAGTVSTADIDITDTAQVTITNDDFFAPSVVITTDSGGSFNESTLDTFTATITFSEPVVGFLLGDLAATNAGISSISPSTGTGTVFTAVVSPDGNGDVTLNVAANLATDLFGNQNTASTPVTVTQVDDVAPTVAITTDSGGSFDQVSPGTFTATVTFSEAITGFDDGDLTASNASIASLDPAGGAGTVFTAVVTPAGTGSVALNVAAAVARDGSANDNSAATQVVVAQVDAPEIEVSSSESGAVADGGTDNITSSTTALAASTVTYTITNTGGTALSITAPSTANATNLSNVTVNSVVLGSTSVAGSGGSTTLVVTYTPTLAGAFSFDLTLDNDDANEAPYNISVSGTADGAPEIELLSSESGALTDGGSDVFVTTPTVGGNTQVTYTISNTGTDTLTLTSPSISNASNIRITGLILDSRSIAPGGSTTVIVRYGPVAAGAFSFNLSLGTNDSDEDPFNFTASGTADGAPELTNVSSESGSVSPINGSDNQGQEPPGVPKVTFYTLTNSGAAPLDLSVPTVGGNVSNQSNVTVNSLRLVGGTVSAGRAQAIAARPSLIPSTSVVTVPAGGTASLIVEYVPTAIGPFSFDVSLDSPTTGSEAVSLTLFGVAAAVAEIDVTSSESGALIDGGADAFATPAVHSTPSTVQYTITNLGASPLNLSPASTSNATNVTVNSLTLGTTVVPAGGGKTTLDVVFTPTAAGPFGFDLVINSDDGDEGEFNIAASGISPDTDAPAVTLTGPEGPAVADFVITVTGSEDLVGLALSDFVVANATLSNLVGSGTTFQVSVSPVFGQTVTVTLPAGAVTDIAGNPTVQAASFSVLAGSPETEFAANLDDIIDTVQGEARRQLTNEMSANSAMIDRSMDRFISSFENNEEATRDVPFDITGSAELSGVTFSTSGSFFEQRALPSDGIRMLTGQFDITRDETGSVTGQIAGRMTWEYALSETARWGLFAGASVGSSNIEGPFAGDAESVGAIVGAYGLAKLGESVFSSAYAGIGRTWTDLNVTNGTLALDSDYATTSYYAGFEIAGSMVDKRGNEFRPSLALDYGSTDLGLIGFDANAFGVSSFITSDLGDVSIFEMTLSPEYIIPMAGPNSGQAVDLSIAPELICRSTTGRVDTNECGAGLSLALDGFSKDGLTRYGIDLNYRDTGQSEQFNLNLVYEKQF